MLGTFVRSCVKLRARVQAAGLTSLKSCRTVANSRCQYSTTSENEKLYEHRVYTVQPENFKFFMDLSTEWMHLRTKHSKLIGYWISEIGGGIHEVIHIWEYDSLSHRASVRQALAKDESWISSYLSKLLPLLQRQDNSLLRLLPGSAIKEPPSNGVYQLESFSYNPAKLDETGNYMLGRQKTGATQIGTFYTVLGIPYFGSIAIYIATSCGIILRLIISFSLQSRKTVKEKAKSPLKNLEWLSGRQDFFYQLLGQR